MSADKPQEFWIYYGDVFNKKPISYGPGFKPKEIIHVIEYSAYQDLLAESEKLAEALKKYTYHRECDDPWYSCPLSEEGCCNDDEPHECNCGAERAMKALETYRTKFPKEEK